MFRCGNALSSAIASNARPWSSLQHLAMTNYSKARSTDSSNIARLLNHLAKTLVSLELHDYSLQNLNDALANATIDFGQLKDLAIRPRRSELVTEACYSWLARFPVLHELQVSFANSPKNETWPPSFLSGVSAYSVSQLSTLTVSLSSFSLPAVVEGLDKLFNVLPLSRINLKIRSLMPTAQVQGMMDVPNRWTAAWKREELAHAVESLTIPAGKTVSVCYSDSPGYEVLAPEKPIMRSTSTSFNLWSFTDQGAINRSTM